MLSSADQNFSIFVFFYNHNGKCLGIVGFFPPQNYFFFFQLVKVLAKKVLNFGGEKKKISSLSSFIVPILDYFLLSAAHKFCPVKRNWTGFDLLQV